MDTSESPSQCLPTKHCSVCDCYVNVKNWASHESGKVHKKKAAKSPMPTASKKRSVDQASLSRGGGAKGGASRSADRPSPRESVLDWLTDMRAHCESHADYSRQYSALQSGAKLSTSISSSLWSAFGKGASGDGTPGSIAPKVFAIDCEMVLCEQLASKEQNAQQRSRIGEVGAQAKVLARVSVVEWEWNREPSSGSSGSVLRDGVLAFSNGKPVKRMDEFVKLPDDVAVVDLLTHVSGIEDQHLKAATLTLSDVHVALGALFGQQDLLIGHSLWADFEVLQMFHHNFLDTAMLFSIQNIANFTPSLKDIVDVMFETTTTQTKSNNETSCDESNEDTSTAEPSHGFQTHGNSHDSVEDAAWAVRVLALRMSMDDGKLFDESTKNSSSLLPYSLPVLPPRFKQRVTFQRLPKGSTTETVSELLIKAMGPTFQIDSVTLRPLKWIEPMVNGDRLLQGSCIVEFSDTDTAMAAFTALPCYPFEGKHPRAPEGYPDRNRFLRKFTPLSNKGECEVLSYIRVGGNKPWHIEEIQQSLVGKLMGKRGRRLLLIQQSSGCLVQVNQVRASAANGKRSKTEGKGMAVLEYWAGSLANAMKAREQVALALSGDDLGIV